MYPFEKPNKIHLFLSKYLSVKILFVNFSKSWGGGEFWHFQQVLELHRRGYDVFMLTNEGSLLQQKVKQTQVRGESLRITNRSFLNPGKLFILARILRDFHPDCMILNGPNDLKFCTLVSKSLKIPKIIYRRGNAERVKPHLSNRWLYKHITHLIVNSEAILQQLKKDFGKNLPSSLYVLHNGIDFPEANPEIDYSAQRIAILGRLSREKGIDLALSAFHSISDKFPRARLILIGDGKERDDLVKQAKTLNIIQKVDFKGFREDYREVLTTCSHMVIPSLWEGFSFAKLEAMRIKLPVISFDIPGIRDVFIDESVIRLVKPYDVDALANAMADLLQSPDLSRKLGENGFLHAKLHYHLPQVVSKLEEIFNAP